MIPISLTSDGQLSADLGGHSVGIPCSLSGLIYLRSLLHERARNPEAKIGTDAAPTQQMVRAFLATHAVEKAPAAMSAAQIAARRERDQARLAAVKDKLGALALDLEGLDL